MALTKRRIEMAKTAYGASEVAGLLGLSKWKSPISIWRSKTTGLDDSAGLAAELGTLLEDPIAKMYAARTGYHLARCATLRHKVQTFALAIATPDRIAFEAKRNTRAQVATAEECEGAIRNVQVKTASMFNRHLYGEAGTDKIPDDYFVQVIWEGGVTGIDVTDVPVLFDKAEFSTFSVRFAEQLFLGMYEVVAKFHRDHVLTGVPPPPDSSDQYADFLNNAFPPETVKNKTIAMVQPGSEVDFIVKRYAILKRIEKMTEEQLKLIKNQVRAAIGDAQGIAGEFGELKWIRSPGTFSTDWEAVARAGIDPDVLASVIAGHSKQRANYSQLRANWSAAIESAPIETKMLTAAGGE